MVDHTDYKLVAASKTAEIVSKKGDVIEKLVIIPATTAAGTVQLKDGSADAFNIFVSGTLSDLAPITIHLGIRSRVGNWQVTTGANVSVLVCGRLT